MPNGIDLRTKDFRKILLIKLSAVGDVTHTIPVLNKLRRRYPAAQIDWLVTPGIAELLRHNPAISNVIEFAREDWSAPWRPTPFISYGRVALALRRIGYDLVVDMHGQLRTAIFTLATGAPVRIGFDKPRADIWKNLTRKIPDEARKHAWQGAREVLDVVVTQSGDIDTAVVGHVDMMLRADALHLILGQAQQ